MSAQDKKRESSGFMSSLGGFGSGARIRAEKSRLEAFLAAVPGEYCGWASDGTVAYSQGFCAAFDLQVIDRLSDIQNILMPEDSSALEGLFSRLSSDGIPFTLNAENRTQSKTWKLSGTRGEDLSGTDFFHILWLEDITALKSASSTMEEEHNIMRAEMDALQDSLDALPHPVWVRDENQKMTWCNVAYAKMIDVRPSDIIAQQKEIVSPDRKRKAKDKDVLIGADLARSALDKGGMQVSETHEVLGGKRLLLRLSEVPVKAKNITVGMAEDLSAHEVVLDRVQNNNSANRALLEQLRSAIAIYNETQELEFYNSSFAQLWGLEDGWLNTKPKLGDVMEKLRESRRLPEQADFRSFKQSWLDMFTGLIDPHDDMLHLPDGSSIRMLVVPHKMGGLMMTFEDVSSRLELESSYNTLIAVQKETLDNLAEGVAVFGGNGRLKLWNPAFARLWAFDPETLEGEPHVNRIVDKVATFFDEGSWADVKTRLVGLALDRSMNDGRLNRSDDTQIDYATVPLPDGGVLVTYTDVTDTIRVEKALRDKNAALEAAERLKLDFLANVSYQLRTPLNAIMGFNEMLTQEFFGSLNEKQKEYTGDIHGASERLLNLINDILDLSTIEAGQMNLEIAETAIKPMMESVGDLVRDWARKEKIEVSLKCPANIGKAFIDETRVKQAVVNLVRNSIAHTQPGGVIDIQASRKGDDLKIVVRDDGIGIAPEDQVRILEPFERTDSGTSSRGAGLGLTLVKNIVSLHGGSFALESKPDEGTSISILLPRKIQNQ